jgi:aldose 1-epimerase
VLNLSPHVYFNLAGRDTILGESLQVFADRYTVFDARKIPTGRIDPVAETELDLRRPTALRDFSLDHNFVLSHPSRQAARLSDPASGRRLEIRTTQPGIHSPNQPGLPSTVLRPGQEFRSETEYRFSVF